MSIKFPKISFSSKKQKLLHFVNIPLIINTSLKRYWAYKIERTHPKNDKIQIKLVTY